MVYFKNNVLVVLTLLCIFISIAGVWVSLGKLMPITGFGSGASGTATASVGESMDITLYNSTIAFGTMDIGTANDTIDDRPASFNISNDGSVYINVSVYSTDLWANQANPSAYYNVSCRNETFLSCDHAGYTPKSSNIVYMPTTTNTSYNVITALPFNATNNSLRIDIHVCVPAAEPSGAKSSTVTFTAVKTFN